MADFAALPPPAVRSLLTVVGARVQSELCSVSCLPPSMVALTKKGLAVTRSFGRPCEAIAHHAARTAEKLRAGGLVAERMMVFLHTNPHGDDPWHAA